VLVLGINIVVVAVLLAVYSFMIMDTGLLGVAISLALVGGVMVVYSTAPQDPTTNFLLNYSKNLVNVLTSSLEDLDLLDSKIWIARRSDTTLAVFSRTPCLEDVDPGIGFSGGSPYIAIPIEIPAIEYAETVSAESSEDIGRMLRSLLIDEFSICRNVDVSYEDGLYRVTVIGLSSSLNEFMKYPLDPYTVITLATISRVLGARCVKLVGRRSIPDGVEIFVKVEKD
jgi:hypothetical protein